MKTKIIFALLFGATAFFITSCGKEVTPPPVNPTVKTPPSVTNLVLGNATQTSFTMNVSITGNNISTRTLYYDTISPCHGKNGRSISELPETVTGLAPGKVYYVCIEAINPDGTTKVEGSISTLPPTPPTVTLPVVSIGTISGNTNTSQTVSGSVTSNGNGTLVGVWFIRESTHEVTGYKKDSVLKGTAVQNYNHTWNDCVPGLAYTYRISAKNSAGTVYSTTVTLATTGYHEGQDLGHGVIFAVNATSSGYIECQKTDKVSLRWWPQGGPYTFQGATSDGLGNGDLNTNAIATHPGCQSTAAAKIAYDCTDNGLTDWYMPNVEEWVLLCSKKAFPGIGPLNGDPVFHNYWTSREDGITAMNAKSGNGDGVTANSSKGGLGNVRLIRKYNW